MRNERETATSILIASCGVQRPLPDSGEEVVDAEPFTGLPGVGVGSGDMIAASRSTTFATIKEMTAKLPVTG